jgi:hypothetical protein
MPLEMLGAFSVSYRIGHEAGGLLPTPVSGNPPKRIE